MLQWSLVTFFLINLPNHSLAFLFNPSARMEPIQEIFEPSGTFDPRLFGKVAVVAWNSSYDTPLGVSLEEAENFKQLNRASLETFIRTAAGNGAKMVLTPEFAIPGYPDIPELPNEDDNYRNRADIQPYVETVPGPSTNFFSRLSDELDIYIQFGFAEVDASTNEYYNTVVVVDPKGIIVAKYRKINLFKLEEKYLSKGTQPVTYVNPFGKMGLIICSDVYSSNPMRAYQNEKVNALLLSTSWAQMNTGMSYFKRAAMLVRGHLLAANQTYFPDSGVINPDGSFQSHIRQSRGIAYGYLPFVKNR